MRRLWVTNFGEMSIHLKDDKPVYLWPYRLAHSERGVVRKKVEQLLVNGVIQESTSDYASPILLIPKRQAMCACALITGR